MNISGSDWIPYMLEAKAIGFLIDGTQDQEKSNQERFLGFLPK